MIQLKNIERSYKTGAGQTWVLRRINLDIKEGEFLTIMGPSGAGKIIAAECAGFARRSVAGRVLAERGSCSSHEPAAARRLGQAQNRHGLPELSPAGRSDRAGEHRPAAFL